MKLSTKVVFIIIKELVIFAEGLVPVISSGYKAYMRCRDAIEKERKMKI